MSSGRPSLVHGLGLSPHPQLPTALTHHVRHGEHADPYAIGLSAFARNFQGTVYALVVMGCLWLIAWVDGVTMTTPYHVLSSLAGLLTFIGLRQFNLLGAWRLGHRGAEGHRMLLHWAGVVGALLFVAYATKYSAYFSRAVLLVWFVASPVALLSLNFGLRWVTRRALPDLAPGRRSVMIFASDSARRFADSVRESHSFDLLGFFDDRSPERRARDMCVNYLGKTSEAADYVRRNHIAVVFIFLSYRDSQRVASMLEELGDTTASVYYVPDFTVFDQLETRMISVESLPMLEVVETPFYGVDGLIKQIFDWSLALMLLTALALPMALVALMIKATSPGPVLFKQKRYGLNGREFSIYKFRTMVRDAPNAEMQQATTDDPRVTPLGRLLRRTSIDELPQLFNVIKGEMSLVGPRPHTVAHNEFYRKSVRRYMVRHKVKPGLTGLAQVEGCRGETAQLELMEKRVFWDLEYIKNWSIGLDLIILIRTVGVVLRGDHAY